MFVPPPQKTLMTPPLPSLPFLQKTPSSKSSSRKRKINAIAKTAVCIAKRPATGKTNALSNYNEITLIISPDYPPEPAPTHPFYHSQ